MTYATHSLYRLLTALCLLLVGLFAWQLSTRWDWGALLFMVIAAWLALRCVRLLLSRVEVTDDRVRMYAPGAAPREVEFRQFSGVHEEGRGLKSILVAYHPRLETGLFDLDVEHMFMLPAVNRHAELLAVLAAKVP